MVCWVLRVGSAALDAGEEARAKSAFLGRRESWAYGPAMRAAAREYKGKGGVVLHLGDSITFDDSYAAWAQRGKGKTPEDAAILRWSHCGESNEFDGWYLATHPVGRNWSYTAAGGITAGGFLGGNNDEDFPGMLSSAGMIAKYNPQIAVVMLGTNDAWMAGTPLDRYAGSMEKIIRQLLDNGTVPIISTIPPIAPAPERAVRYNEELWTLAERYRLPVIDFHGEIVARRPGMTWNGTLLLKDDAHPTGARKGVTPSSEPTPHNLRECGYLLRGWLSVKKIEEVRARVWGGITGKP
jgi:hypothetical protein